jgi:mxaL protein
LSWFFLVLAALNLNADVPKPSHSFMVVIDVTLSMNTKDIQINSDPKTRIVFVRESLENAVRELPCGTKIGIGIFAGYQTSVLFNPVEICENYSDLVRSFGFIETNMIWTGDSEISKGIYNSIKIISKLDSNIRLIFITDGHEAPPIAPAYRPRFDKPEKQVKGMLVGVGGLTQFKIPKINSDGDQTGFWRSDEVMQYDPFTLGRKGSDTNEKLIDNESSKVDPLIVAQIQATPGKEHMTQLKEKYLNLLSREIDFSYLRLTDGKNLANKMYDINFSEWREVNTKLSRIFAAFGLFFLIAAFFPRIWKSKKFQHRD